VYNDANERLAGDAHWIGGNDPTGAIHIHSNQFGVSPSALAYILAHEGAHVVQDIRNHLTRPLFTGLTHVPIENESGPPRERRVGAHAGLPC
jgi:hypothetical protein